MIVNIIFLDLIINKTEYEQNTNQKKFNNF